MQQPTSTTDTKGLKQITPEVTWAQRSSSSDAEKNHVYLTISVPDVDPKQIKLDIQPSHLEFTGYSETKKATYHVKLEFFAEIDPKESKVNHTPRDIELVLRKKELKEEFWPRLLKDKAKVHFLKTNFDKWVDEDEQDEAPEDDYMSRMGGMEGMGGMGGGMGGMGGMGGEGGFGGIDFSKLGGAGGMPDLSSLGGMGGMPDFGGAGDDADDDEDDEVEEVPGTGAKAESSAAAGSSKIEEIE